MNNFQYVKIEDTNNSYKHKTIFYVHLVVFRSSFKEDVDYFKSLPWHQKALMSDFIIMDNELIKCRYILEDMIDKSLGIKEVS